MAALRDETDDRLDAEGRIQHDAAHVADELPAAMSTRRGRRWTTWLKWTLALIVVAFVGRAVALQLADADFAGVAFRWPWLIAAVLLLPGMYASILVSERSLLRAFTGAKLPWRDMIPAAWVPLAGKYVPGKVVAAAGAVVLLKRLGVPAATALGVFVLLDAMPVLTGTILGAALLLDPAVTDRLPGAGLMFGVVVVGGLICLSPPVFRRITTLALRLLRRPPLPHVPGWRDYTGPAICSLFQWLFNGLAVWCALRAFATDGPGLDSVPRIICITSLVMCVSYFGAFLTPSGMGVREAVFIPLLAGLDGVNLPAATAVAVAMRLCHTFVELILCGVGLMLLRLSAPAATDQAIDQPD